jgi:anti-sigma factor RsiW
MAGPAEGTGVSPDDVSLTAWLDGALPPDERATIDRRLAAEPSLAARLAYLRQGDRAFAPAYDALLEAAPAAKLNASLAAALALRRASSSDGQSRRSARAGWLAVAAALLLVAGGAVGYVVHMMMPPPYLGWRQAVAEYHALISPETIAVMAESPEAIAEELSAVSERLSLDLSPEALALPDAKLRRVQLYDYGGQPLVQLVYDTPGRGPFALCIIANGRDDQPLAAEERVGSQIVYWYKDGYGFMLIGRDTTPAELEAYAGEIAGRFS